MSGANCRNSVRYVTDLTLIGSKGGAFASIRALPALGSLVLLGKWLIDGQACE